MPTAGDGFGSQAEPRVFRELIFPLRVGGREKEKNLISWITLLGFAAAFCSTVSFLPQAVRIIRTKDTAALSAPMYVLTTTGFCLWLAYGVALGEWPLILTNGICAILAGFILFMTVASPKQKEAIAESLK